MSILVNNKLYLHSCLEIVIFRISILDIIDKFF